MSTTATSSINIYMRWGNGNFSCVTTHHFNALDIFISCPSFFTVNTCVYIAPRNVLQNSICYYDTVSETLCQQCYRFLVHSCVHIEVVRWTASSARNSDLWHLVVNTLKPRQNGCHFADDTFKCIFLNENFWIPITIWLEFVPKVPINNISALVQIMAWSRPGDKPLSESMMVSLPTHICVTRPQWVKDSILRLTSSLGFLWHVVRWSVSVSTMTS